MIVIKRYSTNIIQEATQASTGAVYTRTSNNTGSSWSSWKRITTNADLGKIQYAAYVAPVNNANYVDWPSITADRVEGQVIIVSNTNYQVNQVTILGTSFVNNILRVYLSKTFSGSIQLGAIFKFV